MTPAAAAELLDILSRIGVLGVTALVILGFLTGRIVSKGHLEEVHRELDEARKAHAEVLSRIEAHLARLDEDMRRAEK